MTDQERRKPDMTAVPQEHTFQGVTQMFRSRDLEQIPRYDNGPVLGRALVSLNGSEHRARRSLENRLFSGPALQRYEREVLEPAIADVFNVLAEQANEDGRAALNVPAFATDLILNISMVLIGFDRRTPADRSRVFECIEPLIAAHEIEWTSADPDVVIPRALDIQSELWERYLGPAYDRRVEAINAGTWDESADLLSLFAAESDVYDLETVAQEATLYLVASVLTTSTTVTNTVDLLLLWCERHPEAIESIVDPNSDFVLRSVEEVLRVRPPLKPLLLRATTNDTTIDGCPVGVGEMVGINVAEANVDPAVYPVCPREFDPMREPAVQVRRRHYSFGDTAHLCIGRPLVVGDPRAGTAGDAIVIVRALFRAGVRADPTREVEFAKTQRARHTQYPVTVLVGRGHDRSGG